MVYNSLTDVPRNLKECIDWLMALKGTDAETNLKAMGAALYNFLVYKPVGKMELPALEEVKRISKEFLEQKEFRDQPSVKKVLGTFNNRMNKQYYKYFRFVVHIDKSDYENVVRTRGTVPEKIAEDLGKVVHGTETFLDDIKNPDKYRSAYCPEATWDASFAKNPEACAVILVGIGPMFYAGSESLLIEFEVLYITGLSHYCFDNIQMMVKALGFKEPECRASPNLVDIDRALTRLDDDELYTVYDLSGFWAFY
ncbi:hypothetical protein, conserved [Babesia ovata]|uniref:Uncharacterized protein n=1 Tax=Babesia ovata TaxID=189622 RepID=A0A2H6KDL4_9APIC|nr:uncharacterized protein BOVATA_025810 [Babesia ovata]GBE61088.1 hypothetical protein, conserved [Babesia ovata]